MSNASTVRAWVHGLPPCYHVSDLKTPCVPYEDLPPLFYCRYTSEANSLTLGPVTATAKVIRVSDDSPPPSSAQLPAFVDCPLPVASYDQFARLALADPSTHPPESEGLVQNSEPLSRILRARRPRFCRAAVCRRAWRRRPPLHRFPCLSSPSSPGAAKRPAKRPARFAPARLALRPARPVGLRLRRSGRPDTQRRLAWHVDGRLLCARLVRRGQGTRGHGPVLDEREGLRRRVGNVV